MGQDLTIFKRNGQTRLLLDSYTQLCTVKSAEQKCALLGEDTVTLKLTSAKPLQFVVGDYMEVFGSVYTLNKFDEPTKNGEGDFEYSLVFEGLQYKLLAAQYRNADAQGLNPTAEFSLVANMRMATGLLLNNVNRVADSNGEVWELGDCLETEFKEYSFSRENCLEVLQRLCQDNNCEFEIKALGNRHYRLNIRQKVGNLFPAKFTFGRGGGIYQLKRRNVNNDDVISRLYVEGGTQNITSKYRNGAQRLRLATNAASYVEDATAIAAFGVKEGSRTYDDIFPCRTSHVSGIVAGDVLSFVDDDMFDLNEKDGDGNTRWLIDGTPAKVKFTGSSNLAGYTFDIQSYDHATHKFKLARYEDSRGFKFPSESSPAYQIEAGAEYVLLDIVMPQDPYEVDAEAKLLERAKADLAADCQPKVSYELDIEGMTLERAYGSEVGITNVFQLGDLLHIVDADINVNKAIRLTGFTRDCYSRPYKYKLTLSDTVEVSLIQSILEDIDNNGQEIINLTNKTDVGLMRMQWRTTQELLGMVFDADGYFDTSHIRPSSIETLMLSVGNRNGQFIMRDVIITCNALVNGKPNPNSFTVQSNGGILQHYAIEEQIRTWWVANNDISLQSDGAMYLYAQCQKTGGTCQLILSQDRMATEVGTYYYFLVGVLSSVYNGYRELTTTYGNTRITGRCINCGRIESIDGGTYFDLDNGEIGGRIKYKSTDGTLKDVSAVETGVAGANDAIDALETQVGGHSTAIDGLTQQIGRQDAAINTLYDNTELLSTGISEQGTTIDEMQAYINGQSQTIQDLQDITNQLKGQVDGTIEYWYGTVDPAADNEPASNWTGDDAKISHLGDIYTNTSTGLEYRYSRKSVQTNNNGQTVTHLEYYWQDIPSTGIGTAIQAANNAVSIANGKSHVYVTASASVTPAADYKLGDLWIMLDTLKMKYCVADSDGIGYKASDWANAGYTDDTAANNALAKLTDMADDGYITPVEKLQMQTFWRELTADYAAVVAQAEAAEVSHTTLTDNYAAIAEIVTPVLADLGSTSAINRTAFNDRINTYYTNRAKLLEALTNKKNTVYVTANSFTFPPATYRSGDLWFTLNDYKVKLCINDCANKTFAASDWRVAGYTDDTAANDALSQLEALADDGILTPGEKLSLQSEMSNINADFVATSGKATALGVDTGAYEAVFNALKDYVNPLLEDMGSNSTVDRTAYNDKFAAYYGERTNVLAAISQKCVDNLEIGQGNYIANGAYFATTKGWSWTTDSQQLYADSVMGNVLRFGKSGTSDCFYLYTGLQNAGGNLMLPDNKFMAGRTYTLAFWVKASKIMSMQVGITDPGETKAVAPYTAFNTGTNWQRISYTFTATDKSQSDTRLYIRGEASVTFSYCLVTKFVLVEGTKAPEWTDCSREYMAQMQANQDTLKAITDNYTEINGGLILSTFLKLGAVLGSGIYQESAGLKAMLANNSEIAAYFGGTYAEALAATKEGMTIVYHNGKLKAKDAEVTGIINARSGTIGSLAIVGNDLIGLDADGIERVRISIGSLPSVGSVFTTSSIPFAISSSNAVCSTPALVDGRYTAYAERKGCDISMRDDGNYTNNAYLTATVDFTLDKDATEVTFGRFDGGYSTDDCSDAKISPDVSGVADLYRVNGSSRTKVGSFPIEQQGFDHSFNSLVKGEYQLDMSVTLSYGGQYWYGDVQLWISGGILVSTSSTAGGNGANILAKDGILSMRDSTHYMLFSFNNGFEARFGSSGLKVSNDGVQKLNSSGTWQTANI